MLPQKRFSREQCARGGRTRAARCRTRNRGLKTELLALTRAGRSITRAADELGIAPSTACRILKDERIVPIVPNLHSPAKVKRVTDRHYAAMQLHLSPARVRGLWECFQAPRRKGGTRVQVERRPKVVIPAGDFERCVLEGRILYGIEDRRLAALLGWTWLTGEVQQPHDVAPLRVMPSAKCLHRSIHTRARE